MHGSVRQHSSASVHDPRAERAHQHMGAAGGVRAECGGQSKSSLCKGR